nr:UBN2 domain-containing protein [Tanacetum cinerariifolium]
MDLCLARLWGAGTIGPASACLNKYCANRYRTLVALNSCYVDRIDEYIDSAFATFNTIITSLKALDEGYSGKNHVRKFLRALNPKWREKVTVIEDSKDITSLSLDELIGNLKVIKKDSKIVKAKFEKNSIALKAKKESSYEECSTSDSKEKEYAMAVRDFKKFFKRRGRFVRQPRNDKKSTKEAVLTITRDSDEEDDENVKDGMCLVAHASSEVLEDKDRGVAEQSGDDAPIKGKRLDVREEATERVSDDTKEMATVLNSMDASTVLSGRVAKVPTGSGSIPTAGPPAAEVPTGSDMVPTAGSIFTTAIVVTRYTRRRGKETMVESETLKKNKVQEQIDGQVEKELEEQLAREDQRLSEQIARDIEIARIHAEEELQIMIDGLDRSNETVAKYLQEYHQFATELPIERRIELISDLVWYQDNYAKESAKKLKTSKEVPEEVKSLAEVLEEIVKEMMQLVPIEEVYVEALQVKHPIIDWKHLDREDLNQLWALVKECLKITPALSDKEIELWVELKRLYEPDDEDQL